MTREERYHMIMSYQPQTIGNNAVELQPEQEPAKKRVPKKKEKIKKNIVPKKQIKQDKQKHIGFKERKELSKIQRTERKIFLQLALATTIVASVCFTYLGQISTYHKAQKDLIASKVQLASIREENTDLSAEIAMQKNGTDYISKATSYGMKKPDETHLITYQKNNSDYVKQYQDIP